MYSIGALSERTGVKVPTIRYYEQAGLLAEPDRTAGNQRRYGQRELERLSFIKHARELGFSVGAVLSLIELNDHPDRSCKKATDIAEHQLIEVRAKLARLTRLEHELARMADGCSGNGIVDACYVLSSLADHSNCKTDH
jgi:DNA-binding transcriptional MerR regulator